MDRNAVMMEFENDDSIGKTYVYWSDVVDSLEPHHWAALFEESDTVFRMQAIEALKHAVPGIKIELP